MQTLLLIGFTAALALTVILFKKEDPDKPEMRQRRGPAQAFCKLHQRPETDCREMHND